MAQILACSVVNSTIAAVRPWLRVMVKLVDPNIPPEPVRLFVVLLLLKKQPVDMQSTVKTAVHSQYRVMKFEIEEIIDRSVRVPKE